MAAADALRTSGSKLIAPDALIVCGLVVSFDCGVSRCDVLWSRGGAAAVQPCRTWGCGARNQGQGMRRCRCFNEYAVAAELPDGHMFAAEIEMNRGDLLR
jgi:hypothetical protein